MIYILQILIIIGILSFSRYAIFIFSKNVNLSSLPMILSQTFTILIWINILDVIFNSNNDISKFKLTFGVLTQIIILYLFWTHINKSGRTSIETIDEVKITISRYGLFKFIRYPIFTIYLLFYFNVFWLFNDHTGIALSLFITIIYIFIGRYRDTQMLDSELSEEYQIYMKKTGLITPSLFYFFK